MNSVEYRQFLLNNMYGASLQSGGTEVVCKCQYCSDNGDHYHMWISIPQTEADLSYFNCFKCGTSGAVTYKRLIEWGIYDNSWNEKITNHNRIAAGLNIIARTDLADYIYSTQIYNQYTELNLLKLKYINDRLGTNLSLEEATDNNIVLDLSSLLHMNHIQKLTRDQRVVQGLTNNFLGFLSYDRNFVNMKNLVNPGVLHESIDKKYINYNIYGKKDNTLKFIIFPTSINPLYDVNLHIAEGPFDALSVKYNLRKDTNNTVYCAVTGNAYKGVIKYFIYGLGIINMNIHLYLDNDNAGKATISDLLYSLQIFNNPIWIHYNTIGKDMGVSIDKINESIERIK